MNPPPHPTGDLTGDVLALTTAWLPGNDEPERPQIQVATVDGDGRPDVRTVLLSAWSAAGFEFHSDAGSRKAAHLSANPAVAIEVLWPGFSRQLVIRGFAQRQSPEHAAAAYRLRSPYLQQLAWLNSSDFAQLPRDERVAAWAAFRDQRVGRALEPSPTWVGYLVRPDRLTFWESDQDTASHRLEYTFLAGAWHASHLAG